MTWEEISKELFEEKTEKRFELIWETDEMCNVFDNDLNVNSTISVEDVVDLLNEQHETIERLKDNCKVLDEVKCEIAEENEQLKEQLLEAKTDEKQLGISFMGYKMKLIEVLQKKYDKVKGKTLYADVYTEIAEEMGVDLE